MKLLTLLVFSFALLIGFSQRQSTVNLADWNALKTISAEYSKTGTIDASKLLRYPVYKINSDYYVSVFGKTVENPDWVNADAIGILKGTTIAGVTTMKVPLSEFAAFNFADIYSYVELPGKIEPLLDKAVKDTHADSVQHGINLPEAFTGKDVFIGVTDWGFDYTQPMFYDTLLQASRIYAAWDQYKTVGNTPANYSYGVEYNTSAELLAAGSDTANIYSYHTHGTHCAGIAGGSGAGTVYRGFAFESQYLFATFLIDAASVIDAFSWMKEKADAEGKRLVISMSWGLTYMGTLDGNSLLSQVIGQLSDQGVVFVAAAGNNSGVNFHIKKTFNNDSFTSCVNFYSYAANQYMWGQSVSMWGEENKPFSAGFTVATSTGTPLVSTPLYSTATQQPYLDSMLVTGQDTIFFNLASENSNPLNNRPDMRLRVKCTNTALRILLNSAAVAGTVHYWNVVELTTGVGNWGLAFTNLGSSGINGDDQYAVGEPGCSPDLITVAAYSSGYTNSQGNPAGGAWASFSSKGPLYTEVMKPDIAAPGVSVASSISSFTDAAYTPIASVTFNSVDYDFARLSGTSMATPCVAGIAALILDANPWLTAADVKTIIKTTARTDNNTGSITAPGSVKWGMGKINAYAAVVMALNTLSVEEFNANNWVIVYPNPASDAATILLPEQQAAEMVSVYSINGTKCDAALTGNTLDCSALSAGTYTVEVVSNGMIYRTRFVKD